MAVKLGSSLRVVSLLPSAAEIICLVAPHDVLVGRSHEGNCHSLTMLFEICNLTYHSPPRADDFPKAITNRPILTAAKTTFTTSEDVNRQVSESLSTGQSLYELDAEALAKLKPDFVVTQVCSARHVESSTHSC